MHESDLLARITIDSEQCGGRPCIRGIRIRVIDVLEPLAAGETPEEILGEYPYLEPEDITASLLYAARQIDHPVMAAQRPPWRVSARKRNKLTRAIRSGSTLNPGAPSYLLGIPTVCYNPNGVCARIV